jgi:hypothetical protein
MQLLTTDVAKAILLTTQIANAIFGPAPNSGEPGSLGWGTPAASWQLAGCRGGAFRLMGEPGLAI